MKRPRPSAAAEAAARKCGAKAVGRPMGWPLQRRPECNRPSGHAGDHIEYDKRTADVRYRFDRNDVVPA